MTAAFFLFGASSTPGVYNVRNYGATGDGSTDDTSSIQAAITASSNDGIIFFPKGTYKVTAPILVASGSSLILSGVGDGSHITANFHGFVFDNLSSPFNAVTGISVIENLHIENSFTGNNFPIPANGTWSASVSPVDITLSGSNPGVAAGGALFINDARASNGTGVSVFVGMITSVASWPIVTVSSTAVASGATSDLTMHVLQCYAAGGAWLNNAATVTMAISRPAGIGTGQYYVYDYEYFLSDRKTNFNIGVATWSGTTLTLTPGAGITGASVGSADRLWLAPVAGCIRYSSVVGATVRDCQLSGFIGVTSSEDKIVANDPTLGGAEGFEITVERCNITNPSGFAALAGQTGIYLQNNSLAYYNSFNSCWIGVRLSGTSNSIIGGRAEVCYFGYVLAGDTTATNNTAGNAILASFSMESNILGIYIGTGGSVNINAVGAICNCVNPIGGMYINNLVGVIQNTAMVGNFGTGYAIYIGDPGSSRQNLALISCSASNITTPSQSWRLPAQSWWGTCIQSDNPALTYTYANLTGVSTNPAAVEGDEFNISDGTDSLAWGVTVTNTGSHTTHYKVRYNGTNWTVVGK